VETRAPKPNERGMLSYPRGVILEVIRFHDFELDVGRYELRRQGRVLRLEKLPMELLLLLLGKNGEVVTREEIIDRIWGQKDVVVDVEAGINTAIRKIRQTLRDDPEHPRFLQTVVGRGYRFVAPITLVTDGRGAATEIPAAAFTAPAAAPQARAPSLRWVGMSGGAAVALLAMLIGLHVSGWRNPFQGTPPPQVRSLAVLPLENLSGDAAQDYFADGMTDGLITDLAKLRPLRVISRSSVMRYKGARKPLPEIAHELGVDAVVEGSVARSGNRVRITVQLIHAPTDRHLWAERYERDVSDVLALQSELSAAIARQIQVELAPRMPGTRASPGPVKPDAYEAYLRGRFAWNKRTEVGLQESIEHFRRAIALDPTYAAAYSGMADAYTTLGYLSYLPPAESFPSAKAAAARALELDPALAEPHASLAYARLYYDWDWASAENEFRSAISLDPNYASAHHWHSVYLTAMGRADEAMRAIRRAKELDPLSLTISTDIGFQLYYAKRYDEAIQQLRSTLAMNSSFPLAHLWLGRAYQEKGMYSEALEAFNRAGSVLRDWPVTLAAIGYVQAVAGQRQRAQDTLAHLKALSRSRYVTAYGVALVYAGLGDRERAFEWLDKGIEERTHWLVWLKLDPRWDGLRPDPRLAQLVRRVGLPQ